MKDLAKAILSARSYYVIRYEMINSRQEKGIATLGAFSTPEEAKAYKDKFKELGYLDSREYSTCQIVKIEN